MDFGHRLSLAGNKHWVKAAFLVSFLLLCYVVLRAWLVPITFDEFWSYDSYASQPLRNILTFKWPTANNHPGNSVLMKVCLQVFGNSPFSLRLPNLLAFVLFLFHALKLARQMTDWRLGFSLFLLLTINPYMLDFFALARGYGLALACTMAAMQHLYALRQQIQFRHLALNAGFAALAVFFNFSYLHFLLANATALSLLLVSHSFGRQGWQWASWKQLLFGLLPSVLASLALAAYMYKPVKALMAANELYYGGESGFWSDTVNTLCHAYIYLSDLGRHDLAVIRKLVLGLLVLMFAFFALNSFERFPSAGKRTGWLAALLMVLPCITATVQHFELGSPFLIYRTAMFLYLPFFVGLVQMLGLWDQIPALKVLGRSLWALLLLACLVNFAYHANLSHSTEWRSDASTPEVVDILAKELASKDNALQAKVGLSWQLRPCFNYYLHNRQMSQVADADFKGCQPGYDYYFVLGNGDGCKLPKEQLPFGEKQGLELMAKFPISNTSLWRNNGWLSLDSIAP